MNLVVFLMRNMSLAHYERLGMFEREMALYREHARHGVRTALVTYGGREELVFAPRLPGIKILCNWPGWSREVYERRLVWLHAPWLMRADVVKADQTDGAEVAVWSARRWRKPVVARCGFSWVDFCERSFGVDSSQAAEVDRISRFVYGAAAHAVVTTRGMADDVRRRYGVPADRLTVVPNYVDTNLFSLSSNIAVRPDSVCSVGRLAPQKNQTALIEAVAGTGLQLDLVGSGPLEADLRDVAARTGAVVRFHGNLPHARLPELIRSSMVFVLPSLYEGHPKTLLEAMACGAAVVGADVDGIRDVIRHGETGWLCAPTDSGLREAFGVLKGDAGLRQKLGANARREVLQHCSLDRVAAMEVDVYRRVLAVRSQERE